MRDDRHKSLLKRNEIEAPITRNTLNRIYLKLDERVSSIVENGTLDDYPYSVLNEGSIEEREAVIVGVISNLYLLLTENISHEDFRKMHQQWRAESSGTFFDSLIWKCTNTMWKKMSGLSHVGLRRVFNRVAFVSYFAEKHQHLVIRERAEATLVIFLNSLRERPIN
ncbi:MAG: hypothetical protein JKY88_18370 [Pseudomonadales bacterium]|nr:hypothetical protein [Pseudomonadales bacterium]